MTMHKDSLSHVLFRPPDTVHAKECVTFDSTNDLDGIPCRFRRVEDDFNE